MEEVCRHVADIENDDIVKKIIIEHDSDEMEDEDGNDLLDEDDRH